jgi:hypothetical protein
MSRKRARGSSETSSSKRTKSDTKERETTTTKVDQIRAALVKAWETAPGTRAKLDEFIKTHEGEWARLMAIPGAHCSVLSHSSYASNCDWMMMSPVNLLFSLLDVKLDPPKCKRDDVKNGLQRCLDGIEAYMKGVAGPRIIIPVVTDVGGVAGFGNILVQPDMIVETDAVPALLEAHQTLQAKLEELGDKKKLFVFPFAPLGTTSACQFHRRLWREPSVTIIE